MQRGDGKQQQKTLVGVLASQLQALANSIDVEIEELHYLVLGPGNCLLSTVYYLLSGDGDC